MRIERTVEVGSKSLRVVARTRGDDQRVCSVRVFDGHYFRDLSVADAPIDEAVEKAVAMFLGKEGSTVMSKRKKTAKATGRGKGARSARASVRASRNAQAAPERATTQQGAPEGKKKRLGLLNEAVAVLQEAGRPMNAKEMVEAVLAKGQWATKGKTPAATLYASILREIQKKGDEARFVKTERGKFSARA